MTPPGGGMALDLPQSVSPGSIPAAPMARTAILPASVMNVRPQAAIQGPNWSQIPGAGSYAAAAPDGSLWVLSNQPSGSDKYIWHYVNGAWTNISGLASKLSVAADGTLYAINSVGGAYSYSGGTWTALGGGCSDITAASTAGSFYVLSNGNSAGSDQAIWQYVIPFMGQGSWSQVPGSGVRIAASRDPNSYTIPSGTISARGLYIVNSIGSIWYKNLDNSYVQFPGSASAIAPTTIGGVFVLGYPSNSSGNAIYYYNLSTPGWSAQGGSGVGISTDSAHVYVIGSSGAIYSAPVITTNGMITDYPLPASNGDPQGIAAGPDGNLWFTEETGDKIGKITTGGTITEYTIPAISHAGPTGIATGPDGNLWFTEYNGNKIGKITASGSITEYPIPTPSADPGGLKAAGIAAGSDGNMWFIESNAQTHTDKIGKITTGGAVTEYPFPNSTGLRGIAAGPDGNLWFTEYVGRIGKITTGGTLTEYNVPTIGTGPWGIAVGPDGNLWFTEYLAGNIGKITPAGVITQYAASSNASPDQISAGPDGNLWFTEEFGSKIGRITTSGTVTEYTTSLGNGSGITSGPDGNLWFAEYGVNRIGKITP
jgi:streptogramin lyase